MKRYVLNSHGTCDMCGMEELEEGEMVATGIFVNIEDIPKQEVCNITRQDVLNIVDECFHAFASSRRTEATEMAEELLNEL